MKKSNLARRILRKLKEWEGSQMQLKTANEIIDVCLEAGMQPPDRLAHLEAPCDVVYEWDLETKRRKK